MDTRASEPALAAELRRIALILEGYAAAEAGEEPQGAAPVPGPEAEGSPLDLLCRTFGLSAFERDILLLCAGVELDAECASRVARIQQGGPATPSLALAALPDAHWSALLPTGPLRYWRLIELGAATSLVGAPLRIDERILHYLVGLQFIDERLAGLVDLVAPPAKLVPSQQLLAERIARLWHAALEREEGAVPVVQLCGDDPAARQAIAAQACALVGSPLLSLDADDLPQGQEPFERIQRLWEREALLVSGCRMLVARSGAPDKAADRRIERIAAAGAGPLILSSSWRRPAGEPTMLTFEVARPPPDERIGIWREALGARAPADAGGLRALSHQFDLDVAAIRAAAAESLAAVPPGDSEAALHDALWDSSCRLARCGLADGVQLIQPSVAPGALVLPPREQRMLAEIVAQVRHRAIVHGDWGFAEAGGRGLGIALLFSGPSGTGKTLAAETVAAALRLDLLRIDLGAVVGKYIGETERELKRAFDAAQAGGAVLLFEEAEALFGKRTEVKDSHDRYAVLAAAYLLQRNEAFPGLTIFTSGLEENLDPAFLRRLRFILHFPFPDAAQRARIWKHAFPPAAPLDGLDHDRLAQLDISGGSIRNIALNAAFRAAAEGGPVTMARIKAAARSEYAKLAKTLTEAETRGWK